MTTDKYSIEPVRPDDIGAIMELESGGFHAGIREAEAVFLSRFAVFPDGFVALRSGDSVLGYLCCERWADVRPDDAAGFELGHDPVPRHAPEGTVLYLASMTVDPHRRGAGLGAFLFGEGRASIHRAVPGLAVEILLVNEAWTGARRIYEAAGFGTEGSLPAFFPSPEGPPSAGIVMSRRMLGVCSAYA